MEEVNLSYLGTGLAPALHAVKSTAVYKTSLEDSRVRSCSASDVCNWQHTFTNLRRGACRAR